MRSFLHAVILLLLGGTAHAALKFHRLPGGAGGSAGLLLRVGQQERPHAGHGGSGERLLPPGERPEILRVRSDHPSYCADTKFWRGTLRLGN